MKEIRVDRWLWNVRLFKSRTKANRACKKKKVKINNDTAKPSSNVKHGDIILFKKGAYTLTVKDFIDWYLLQSFVAAHDKLTEFHIDIDCEASHDCDGKMETISFDEQDDVYCAQVTDWIGKQRRALLNQPPRVQKSVTLTFRLDIAQARILSLDTRMRPGHGNGDVEDYTRIIHHTYVYSLP